MKTKSWSKLIICLFVFLVLGAGTGPVFAASGTFRQGIDVDVKTWNPHMEQMNLRMIYFSPMYEGLVGEDENGNVTPLLATKWKQTPDSITFTLRDDVYFTDGAKFDANVVKLNIESVKKGKFPATKAMLSAIKSVDVIDDTHVRFNLSRPASSLLSNLQRFAGLMVSPASLGSADLSKHPIGTGPWKLDLKKTVHNSKYVYTLNEKYWDPSQQGVAQIEIYYLPDPQAQVNAMMTGKLEASECATAMIPQAKSAGFKVLMPESFHLGLHIMDRKGKIVPEFADKRVRKALALAIDRKAYFKAIKNGVGMPSTQRFLPGQYGHDEGIEDLTYNPKRAKALLKEAGVKNLTFEVPSFGPFDLWNEGVAGFFKKIGVTMKIKPITPGAIFSEPASWKWAAALVPLNERHPEDFYNNRVSPKGFLNPFKIVEKDLEELAKKARNLDRESAGPIWSKICGQVAERGIIIHLDGFSTVIIVNTKKAQNVKPMYFMPGVVRFRGITVK